MTRRKTNDASSVKGAAGGAPIETPCLRICVVHPQERICVGCYRTPEEIAAWRGMSSARRRAIMGELEARAHRLSKRRGGRAARLKDPRADGA